MGLAAFALDEGGRIGHRSGMERASYVFAAIFAAVMGGFVISITTKAVDTLEPFWVGASIALVAILIGGAIALDRRPRS